MKMRTIVLVAATALLQTLAAETYVVTSGETLELGGTGAADARNSNANTIQLQGGSTLKLKPAGGYANINCKVELKGGVATLDCTALTSETPKFGGGIRDFNAADAGLRVKGAKLVKVGSGTVQFEVHDLPFVDADDQPVTDGKLSCEGGIIFCWPTGCAHEIATGSTLYFCSPTPLLTGDVTLDRYDLWLYNDTSLEKTAKVTVNTGHTLYLKPMNYPTWTAAVPVGATNSNDIVLNGGKLSLASMPTHYVDGAITGTGTVATGVANSHAAGSWDAEAIYLRSTNVTFKGTVLFGGYHNRLAFTKTASPGDPDNEVRFSGNGASWILFTDKDGLGPTNVTIKKISVTANDLYTIGVAAHQTVTVGEFANAFAVPGAPILTASGSGKVELPADACGLAVQRKAGETVFYAPCDGPQNFQGQSPLKIRALGDGQVVANIPSSCVLSAAEGRRVTVYNENGGEVRAESGEIAVSAAWRELPALWLDASATDTLHGLGEDVLPSVLKKVLDAGGQDPRELYMSVYTNGYKLVEGWHDCRGRTAYKGFNSRLYNDVWSNPPKWSPYRQNYPYVVPYGSEGLCYLNFARCAESGKGSYTDVNGTVSADGMQNRRMPIMLDGTTTEARIPATLVVMVFGSQQGGGMALLGTSTGAFGRTDDTLNAGITTNTTARVWMNGAEVDPTTAKLSGGWDVITVDATGHQVNGLGWLDIYSTGGGQNYAEVIIYTNACSAATRVLAERHLAKKWGLYDKYADDASVAEPVSSVLAQGPSAKVAAMPGVTASISGKFAGAVELDGGTLDLMTAKATPAFADLPTNGRVGWYDPDNTNGLYLVRPFNRPNAEVQALYDCGVYPRDGTNFLWAPTSRRPQWKREARGLGPERGWLDFNDPYPNDVSTGNALRPRKYPDTKPDKGDGGTALTIPVRTVLMAIDSSNGGGSPMGAKGVGSGRVSESVAVPIWPPASDTHARDNGITDTMRNGETFLDGVKVESPTKTGYSGRPEVLSLTTATAWNLATFGLIYNTESGLRQGAVLGEIFMYDTALSGEDRLKVEAYLMDKWIGKLPVGYGDLRQATVTGSGRVVASDVARLPAFDAGFSGEIVVRSASAVVPMAIDAEGSVTGAVLAPGARLEWPESVEFVVTAPGNIPPGDYVLVTCREFATDVTPSVRFVGRTPAVHELVCDVEDENRSRIVLRVIRPGVMVIVR